MSDFEPVLHSLEGQVQSRAILALADYLDQKLQLKVVSPVNFKDKLYKKGSH